MEAGNARHVTRVRKADGRGARVSFPLPSLPLPSQLSVRGTIKNIADAAVRRYLGRRIDFFRYRGLDRLAGNDVAGRAEAHLARVAPPSAFSRALARPSSFLPASLISCGNLDVHASVYEPKPSAVSFTLRRISTQLPSTGGSVGHERSMKTKRGRFSGSSSLGYRGFLGLLGCRTYNGYKSNRTEIFVR